MGATIDTTTVGEWRVATAAGDLDVAVAPLLHSAVTDLLGAGAAVVDLSGASLLDAACINVLVRAARRADGAGAPLRLVGAHGAVQRVLQITGAPELNVDLAVPGWQPSGREVAADAVEAMLAARAALPQPDARRDLLRERAVQTCLPLAQTLAGRYRRPNEPGEELTQIAVIGLLKAVDRFDPARGTGFLGFALPTMLGEIRRYFRDQTWAVHVPRHLQELRLSMNQTAAGMTQALQREPTAAELAERLDEPVETVREAMVAAAGYAPASLSQPVGGDGALELGDLIGRSDDDLDRVEDHEALTSLMERLPRREQQALAYRFFGNMTQTQIAGILGVSQMQVSRLLRSAVTRLRAGLLAAEAE